MDKGTSQHPPKPYLVVRVGITGHRPKALKEAGADIEDLRKTIRTILTQIKKDVREIFEQNSDFYAGTGPILRLISPLAEGSDRLVARAALGLQYELQCPLPFSLDDYEATFTDTESKFVSIAEFRNLLPGEDGKVLVLDGRLDTASKAYEAVGRVVLRQSDILLSIWDGKPPEKGGTGQITREALKRNIPTIWIQPKAPHPAFLLKSILETGEAGECAGVGELESRLRNLLVLDSEKEIEALTRFRRERQPKRRFAYLFRIFCKIFVWRWKIPGFRIPTFQDASPQEWREPWTSIAGSVGSQIEESFRLPFNWADGLAGVYADRHRSSFVAIYLLGAFAVLAAFLGHKTEWPGWFPLELSFITVVLILFLTNRLTHWHERWIDYRLLAEGLRQMQFLSPFARVTPAFEVPAYLGGDDPRPTWFNWYFQSLVRQAGLVRAEVDPEYLEVCRQVLDRSVRSQIKYHEDNDKDLHQLHHYLYWLTLVLFFVTLCACALHLFSERRMESLMGHGVIILAIFAVALPAFGAAIEGINHQGEFERISRRSRAIKARLESIVGQIPKSGQPLSFRDLGRKAESFCETQLLEQADWRSVFISKEVGPA